MDISNKPYFSLLLLILVIAIPLLACIQLNQLHSVSWFIRAGIGVILIAQLILVCSRIAVPVLRYSMVLLLTLLSGLFLFSRFISFYIQGQSYNERFWYHATADTLSTAASTYPQLLTSAVLFFLLTPCVSLLIMLQRPCQFSPRRSLALGLLSLSLIPLVDPDISYYLRESLQSRQTRVHTLAAVDWEKTGLNARALERKLGDVAAGRNLLLIYLEGYEQVFTDQALFPGLSPFLGEVKERGLFFPQMSQTPGTDWTIAGMLASQCGTPLMTTVGPGGNDVMQSGYINRATCLSDILHAAGYQQVFLGGADSAFAGKGRFLQLHRYDQVLGREELKHQLEDPERLNNWGLYDDSLFALAEQKFLELVDAGQPFNLSLLTVDTHLPGHASPSCPPYLPSSEPLLQALHCTDFLLARFIGQISQHPRWEDTLVVFFSDHLMMVPDLNSILPVPDAPERKLYLGMLNSGRDGTSISGEGAHMDVAATVLDLLGVSHQQDFLAGHSMLSPAFRERGGLSWTGERDAALRYINTNIFTSIDNRICSDSLHLLQAENNRLYLNKQEVYVGEDGTALPLGSLGEDHSFVTLFEEDGSVVLTTTMQNAALPGFFQTTSDYYHLVVTSSPLASLLDTGVNTDSAVSVLLGHPLSDRVVTLGSFAAASLIDVPGNCSGQLRQVKAGQQQAEDFPFAKYCSLSNREADTTIDTASNTLTLQRVSIDDSWYSASLKQVAENLYSLIAYEQLQPDDVQQDSTSSYCHARKEGGRVLVPYAQTASGYERVILEEVPGDASQFRLVERAIL